MTSSRTSHTPLVHTASLREDATTGAATTSEPFMKVALFEPSDGGHRATYIRRFVDALSPVADVVVAISDDMADALAALPAEIVRLGPSVRIPDGISSRGLRAIHNEEIERFHAVAAGADHTIHLFADHLLPQLVTAPRAPAPTSLLIFFPRGHYSRLYDSPLGPRDRLVALAQEAALSRWRKRADAHAVWTLDEGASMLRTRSRGAVARWLPEPPVSSPPTRSSTSGRDGCALYGALTDYKGIDRLARSMSLQPTELRVTLAGAYDPTFREELDRHVRTMREAGVRLDLRDHPHTELEGLAVLAEARCVVLPYHRHAGMSRVLIEAAVAGTPVVVHRFGLLGYLTDMYGIGLAVDASNPSELRAAILGLCEGPDRGESYTDALARFAQRYSAAAFCAALRGPLGLVREDQPLARQVAGLRSAL